MEKIVISYSRHDILGDKYSDDYRFKARKLIDDVADEIRETENSFITSLAVKIEEALWSKTETLEPVYSMDINEKYFLQFKIEELMKCGESWKIAKRLNEIILEKLIKNNRHKNQTCAED